MHDDLFDIHDERKAWAEPLSGAATLYHGRLACRAADLLACLPALTAQSAFRHLSTPGGRRMSVAMSNCGSFGWVSDRHGYRYESTDPLTGRPWPAMPRDYRNAAREVAAEAGYPDFRPDVCLINRYLPGARLSLHQDRDERADEAPIVSFSFGLPAVFLWGGQRRADPVARFPLKHGDAVVWGSTDRFRYHGIAPLKDGGHDMLGALRINMTFRQTGLSESVVRSRADSET